MNNKGFTIPEAILGTMIMIISLFALLSAFSFGFEQIERIGIKRQALSIIQQEYEKLKRYSYNGEFGLEQMATINREVQIKSFHGDDERIINGWLSTVVSDGFSSSDNVKYQEVLISLRFEYEGFEDTVSLPFRNYNE